MADQQQPTQPPTPRSESGPQITFGPTVTIFFSDIRGFTEYTDAHGDEAAYRMLRHHNDMVQEQIALYGGHIVKTLGDSFMVSFDSARNALACAIGAQKELARYNSTQQGAKIEIGVGINTGEPIREGDDLFGGSVNLASRICAVAGAGRILVSETVRNVVGRLEGSDYIDRGYFEIRGFQEPQHLYEADWSGVGAVRATQVAPPIARGPQPIAPVAAAPARASSRRWFWLGGLAAVLVVAGIAAFALISRGSPVVSPSQVAASPGTPLAKPKATVAEATPAAKAKPTEAVAAAAPADPAAASSPQAKTDPAGKPAAPGAGPPAASPAVAGPGLLYSDNFSDPSRGHFRDNQRGTTNVNVRTGAVPVTWEYAYSGSALVGRIRGTYPPELTERPAIAINFASIDRVSGDFAAEIRAQVTRSPAEARVGLTYDGGGEDVLLLGLRTVDGVYQGVLGRGLDSRQVARNRAASARLRNLDNVLRFELRGDMWRLLINGPEVETVKLPARPRSPGQIVLQVAMIGPPADGDIEVRFTDYRVYSLAP